MSPQRQKLTLQLIWAIMVAAVVLYGIVASALRGQFPPRHAPAMLLWLFWLFGAVGIGIGWLWLGRALGEANARLRGARADATQRAGLMQRLVTGAILSLTLTESMAVCGLVLVFVGPLDAVHGQAMVVLSLAGLLALRLRRFPEVFALVDRLGQPE
ncbi:MAG: hypothetical protein HYZ89_03585 [Candidatus Omnitrophica bacterium]|nr:hypothetical protein [Candidatus Omnitrophota bacterium]